MITHETVKIIICVYLNIWYEPHDSIYDVLEYDVAQKFFNLISCIVSFFLVYQVKHVNLV